MPTNRLLVLICLVTVVSFPVLTPAPASADSQPATAISSYYWVPGVAIVIPHYFSKNPERHETSLRIVDSLLMGAAVEEIGKSTIHSPRPAPSENENGFPSGHTTAAFAFAASLSENEPHAAYWAYPLAAAVGWSRVQLNRHTWSQVLGGAVFGTYIGMRAGKGQWRLFGHKDSQVPMAATAQAASMLLNHQIALWGTDF